MRLSAYPLYVGVNFCQSLFSSTIFTVLAVYYVQDVGLNPLQLVLVGTLLEATIFIFEIPTGVIADLYSRRLSVIVGIALIGLCYVVQGLFPLLTMILLAEFVRGVGETFISGAFTAWIADEVGENQLARIFLRSAQARRLGALLGIGMGTILAAFYTPALSVFVGGVLMVGLSGVLIFIMPETHFHRAAPSDRTTWQTMLHQTQTGLAVIRRQPVLLMFVFIGVLYGSFSEGFDRLWEAHFLHNFVFPAWLDAPPVVWIGLLNGASFVMGIAISELVIRRVNLESNRAIGRTLLAVTVLLMGALLLFGLAPGFELAALAFLMVGALRSLQYPLSATWLNRHIPAPVRATVLSFLGQTDALGQIMGGPGVGAVGLRSLRAAMIFSALLLAPIIALYARRLRHSNPVSDSSSNSTDAPP
ncbi:MAG: MFS transporter [Litorilinea sp.]